MNSLLAFLSVIVSLIFMVYCAAVGQVFGGYRHPNDKETDPRHWIIVGVLLGISVGVLGTLVFTLPTKG